MSKKEFEDDGRVVADMSLTRNTSPWFSNYTNSLSNRGRRRKKEVTEPVEQPEVEPLTKEETRSFIFSAILAGLSMSLIFVAGAFLFILFCVYVWFA